MKIQRFSLFLLLLVIFLQVRVMACTNLIITKGASSNGSVMITYAADSHTRYGALFFYPAAQNPKGSMLEVYHYENGKLMGTIPEAAQTYNVIGFMNEHQVAIGETTWGGLDSLANQPGAIMDYGSLMKIALQRSKSAREAIKVMTELVEKYGYATQGESFSISDANEAWIMEMIGKGRYEKGAVWVAMQIPDGCISGHANHARITTFPMQKSNDWFNTKQMVFHSPDVISFARKIGNYKGSDADFSFSDVYNPVDFGGARYCESRVWAFFRKFNAELRDNPVFDEYVCGVIKHQKKFADGRSNPNGFATNRMPLWIMPDKKIELAEVMATMRDHFEGTHLDMRYGIGAGPFNCPYRWRPMEFKVDTITYLHERAIATQQTGYSFVAQSRSWLPNPVGGIFWFGVDDADGCVYAPMYCGIDKIPESYAVGNGSMIEWSETSAFWTFNLVTNWAYTRYNMIHPEIEQYQMQLEKAFIEEIKDIDTKAAAAFAANKEDAVKIITEYSVKSGNELVIKWKKFFTYLFMKYMDGNLKQGEQHQLMDNGNGKGIPKSLKFPGYGKDWERLMMLNTGERFKVAP